MTRPFLCSFLAFFRCICRFKSDERRFPSLKCDRCIRDISTGGDKNARAETNCQLHPSPPSVCPHIPRGLSVCAAACILFILLRLDLLGQSDSLRYDKKEGWKKRNAISLIRNVASILLSQRDFATQTAVEKRFSQKEIPLSLPRDELSPSSRNEMGE